MGIPSFSLLKTTEPTVCILFCCSHDFYACSKKIFMIWWSWWLKRTRRWKVLCLISMRRWIIVCASYDGCITELHLFIDLERGKEYQLVDSDLTKGEFLNSLHQILSTSAPTQTSTTLLVWSILLLICSRIHFMFCLFFSLQTVTEHLIVMVLHLFQYPSKTSRVASPTNVIESLVSLAVVWFPHYPHSSSSIHISLPIFSLSCIPFLTLFPYPSPSPSPSHSRSFLFFFFAFS